MTPEERGYFSTWVKGPGTWNKIFLSFFRKPAQTRPRLPGFNPKGCSDLPEVIDPDTFQWEDHFWKGIPLEKLIFYEIHTGTSTAEGTFEAVIAFLDYFKTNWG